MLLVVDIFCNSHTIWIEYLLLQTILNYLHWYKLGLRSQLMPLLILRQKYWPMSIVRDKSVKYLIFHWLVSYYWALRCQRKLGVSLPAKTIFKKTFPRRRRWGEGSETWGEFDEKLIKLTCKVANGDLTQTKTAIANTGKIT